MDQDILIDSVFEEKLCICGHYSVDKFTNLTDTFIKYKNKIISFVEILRETLGFEPLAENCSMEVCEQCKIKLQEFYNFKIKSLEARTKLDKHQELISVDIDRDGSIECTMLDIIQKYVKTYSIKSIEIQEETQNMLVISGKREEEEPKKLETSETKEQLDVIDDCNSEYLEEFLDEDNSEDYDIGKEHSIEMQNDEIFEEEQKTDKNLVNNSNSSMVIRLKNPEEWACNKRKKLRNSGKSYINSKGNLVRERRMLESCAKTNCRSNCHLKIPENDRIKNFDNFWNLGDIIEQRKSIYNHILSKEPTRRKSVLSNRSVTLQFYLDTWDTHGNVTLVQVCKKMFKNTLALSNQVIQGVVSKYSVTGFLDARGKHKRKVTEAQKLAQEHVGRFPFFYVERNMTKVQLYNLYVEECRKSDIEPVKESNYREIFDKFNTNTFLKGEKVTCDTCKQYYKATQQERDTMQHEFNKHLEKDKKCRDRVNGRIRHRRLIEKRKSSNIKLPETQI